MTMTKWFGVTVVALALAVQPLNAQERPTLTVDDYDQWERLGGTELSPDGAWMAVSIGRVSEEGELRIHSTSSDSVVVVPFGTRAAFSPDSRWVFHLSPLTVWVIIVSELKSRSYLLKLIMIKLIH